MSNILCLTWPVASQVTPESNLWTLSERPRPGLSISGWIFLPRLLVTEIDGGRYAPPPPRPQQRAEVGLGPAGRGLNDQVNSFYFWCCTHMLLYLLNFFLRMNTQKFRFWHTGSAGSNFFGGVYLPGPTEFKTWQPGLGPVLGPKFFKFGHLRQRLRQNAPRRLYSWPAAERS